MKKLPVTLVSLLYPYEGEAPDIGMDRLSLSEDDGRNGVIGLRIGINGREHLIFFAPDEYGFSHHGVKLRGPIAFLPI